MRAQTDRGVTNSRRFSSMGSHSDLKRSLRTEKRCIYRPVIEKGAELFVMYNTVYFTQVSRDVLTAGIPLAVFYVP